jgi:fatty acid desaturase
MVKVDRVTGRTTVRPSDEREPQEPWETWWLWLWGVVAVALIVLIFFLPFKWWGVAALVGFGTLEGFGLSSPDDGYPPLTQAIRKYVWRWLAFGLIYGVVGGAGATWLKYPHPWRVALLVGLLGWFTAHFDVTYDNDAAEQERAKYQMVADGIRRIGERMRGRRRSSEVSDSVTG